MRSNLQYDPSSGKMNAGNFLASYTREDRAVFNVGYTYRRPVSLVGNQPVTEQSHLSTYYPINNNWRFFMAWNYSLEAHRSVEDMLGFEYDSCCWRIRLLYLRYFDTVRDEVPNFDSPGARSQKRLPGPVSAQGPRWFWHRRRAAPGRHDSRIQPSCLRD
jgi:LPS-assembly protein